MACGALLVRLDRGIDEKLRISAEKRYAADCVEGVFSEVCYPQVTPKATAKIRYLAY